MIAITADNRIKYHMIWAQYTCLGSKFEILFFQTPWTCMVNSNILDVLRVKSKEYNYLWLYCPIFYFQMACPKCTRWFHLACVQQECQVCQNGQSPVAESSKQKSQTPEAKSSNGSVKVTWPSPQNQFQSTSAENHGQIPPLNTNPLG